MCTLSRMRLHQEYYGILCLLHACRCIKPFTVSIGDVDPVQSLLYISEFIIIPTKPHSLLDFCFGQSFLVTYKIVCYKNNSDFRNTLQEFKIDI